MFYTFQAIKALSGETRFKIVTELLKGKKTVKQISDAVGQTQDGTSHQLSILLMSEVVSRTKDGRNVIYEIADTHTGKAARKIMKI